MMKALMGFPAQALAAVPNWPAFERLGESRTVRSTYVWVFLVPIVARAFASVPETIQVPWMSAEIHVSLRLPFSWEMGYYAALSFACGSFVYQLFSPAFSRRYKSYPDFGRDMRGSLSLMTQFLRLHMRRSMFWPLKLGPAMKRQFLALTEFSGDVEFLTDPTKPTPIAALQLTKAKAGHEADAFYVIQHQLNRTYVLARLVCLVSYLLGFLFILRVAWESFLYVRQWSAAL
jgi:hypothetical protein